MILVRNQPNQENLKHLPPRRTSQQRNMQMSHSHPSLEVDPDMPPLEDVDTPRKKFKLKNPA